MRLIGVRRSAIGAALLLTTGLLAMSAQATQGDGGGGSAAQTPPSHVSQKDDAPTAGDPPCPPRPANGVVGTCVQVLNQSSLSFTDPTIRPNQGTTVRQAPPKQIAPGGSGVWATVGNNLGDGAIVVFKVPGGQSTVNYATLDSVAMTVINSSDPPYYNCQIQSSKQNGWFYVRIIYRNAHDPGNCSINVRASAKGTGPATPTPSPTPQP